MFSSKSQLKNRTPQNGTDREKFMSLLVDEYLNSTSLGSCIECIMSMRRVKLERLVTSWLPGDAKCQVLANLANFAYDPINYVYIRDVGVLDIFLYVIKNETNYKLIHFASAGVCNLCNDPLNAEYILTHVGLNIFIALLKCDYNEIVADVITILIYLYNPQTEAQINTPEVIQTIQDLKNSENKTVSNLATIFLQDVSSTN